MKWPDVIKGKLLTDRRIEYYARRGYYGPKLKEHYEHKDAEAARRRAHFLRLQRERRQDVRAQVKRIKHPSVQDLIADFV